MNIYWEMTKTSGGRIFWILREDDFVVLIVEPDGTLVKNESGRHPLTFGNTNEPITGKFGTRKAY
jgi:hypothetical protein